MNRTILGGAALVLLAAAAFAASISDSTAADGAQQPQSYKVGDRVEADPMLIGAWRKATVVKIYTPDGRLNGYEVRMDAEGNRPAEEYTVGLTVARGIRPAAPGEPEIVAQGNRLAPAANGRPTPRAAGQSPVVECPTDAILGQGGTASDPLDLSFKRAILGRYQKKTQETSVSTPLGVGIQYESFQVGSPRTNNRTLDRVDGSYLRAAPVGAPVYPVKTRFTVCERYARERTFSVIDGRYECFRDNFGAWACANSSGWRLLETRRES